MPIFETMLGFKDCNRYTVHSKIDDIWRQLPRDGARNWHPSVVETDRGSFVGSVRTTSQAVMAAAPQAKWRELVLPEVGSPLTAYVQIIPKKTHQFGDFRNHVYATQFMERRLNEREVLTDFSCEYIAHDMIDVDKKGAAFHVLGAWFRIAGRVASRDALERMMLTGVGGACAFGVGLLNPKESQIHLYASSVAHAAAVKQLEKGLSFH